jgi:hypothetical protein
LYAVKPAKVRTENETGENYGVISPQTIGGTSENRQALQRADAAMSLLLLLFGEDCVASLHTIDVA